MAEPAGQGAAPVAPSGLAERIDAFLHLIARGLAALAAAACAAMLAVVVAAVVMRYAVRAPFLFTEELSGLLLAAMTFLSLPLTLTGHGNIRVTLISARLRGVAQRAFWVLGQFILLAFALVFLKEAWGLAEFTLRLNLASEQARLPLGPWMVGMAGLVAFIALIAAWQALRPPPVPGNTII
ncbi:MAG: TRAP transporter small permease subunit [Alphaproteobacteria bacterium]|nr:TRAP transporter small permease subunit [Alphaproteobacteria bacterium]